MSIFWYISPVDGRFTWHPEGRYKVDHSRLLRLANTLDKNGFDGALIGTYAHDVLVTASSLIASTDKLKFLIPIYPGVVPPALLAQQALTFDDYSNGRLMLNLVNGTDSTLAKYGVFVDHDERYEMSLEYWKIFKDLYSGKNVSFTGKYFSKSGTNTASGAENIPTQLPLGPIQEPCIPLWGAGASPAGIHHAANIVDTYLAFFQSKEKLQKQLEEFNNKLKETGRSAELGTLATVIVRKTRKEALDFFKMQLANTNPKQLAAQINAALIGNGVVDGLAGLKPKDPKTYRRIEALLNGQLPAIEDLEIAPNTYAGLASWAQFDLNETGGGSTMIGSGEDVAEIIRSLRTELNLQHFILSGWPLEQEANYAAEYLLPLIK
ncbi:MAG: LLM class flavin-dependent oxidoreductase [Acinetobacter amyesii]|uniref:LLM class flavin-dependent oxidoreductase n=1 Tax=Acinetobacter amyesii TaxID=2942470 RepID=UPI003CFD9934